KPICAKAQPILAAESRPYRHRSAPDCFRASIELTPKISVEQTPFAEFSLLNDEAAFLEKRVRQNQVMRGQECYMPKERIHYTQDQRGAPFSKSRARLMKIGQQPAGSSLSAG